MHACTVHAFEPADVCRHLQRSALEHDKASLFACVNELQSKFSHLEAEHARTLEASGTWKAKWEEEQQRTHLTLTEGARQTQQLQHQLDTSLVTVHKLSKEVDAKNVIIATLQQRGQELLTELSGLGEISFPLCPRARMRAFLFGFHLLAVEVFGCKLYLHLPPRERICCRFAIQRTRSASRSIERTGRTSGSTNARKEYL